MDVVVRARCEWMERVAARSVLFHHRRPRVENVGATVRVDRHECTDDLLREPTRGFQQAGGAFFWWRDCHRPERDLAWTRWPGAGGYWNPVVRAVVPISVRAKYFLAALN